jgi:hypothetical protein
MEQHKGVKVRVIWVKDLGVVQVVEVLNVCGDLQLVTDAIFNNGTKGILRGAGRKRVLVVSICHTFRADEDQVEGRAGEEPG